MVRTERLTHHKIAGDTVHKVDRVLDVRQGELCWVAGTVYMDMPLKPNILDDISKDVRIEPLSPNGPSDVVLALDSGTTTTRKVYKS